MPGVAVSGAIAEDSALVYVRPPGHVCETGVIPGKAQKEIWHSIGRADELANSEAPASSTNHELRVMKPSCTG